MSRATDGVSLRHKRIMDMLFCIPRHLTATMLYHQTKDILHVMRFLDHKNIKNTNLH